jgi:hypothetical protein
MRPSVTLAPAVGRATADVVVIGSHSYMARDFLPSIVKDLLFRLRSIHLGTIALPVIDALASVAVADLNSSGKW